MRIDVRCRAIHYLELASRHVKTSALALLQFMTLALQGNYYPDREVGEPDPYVLDLNLSLGECEDIVSTTVPKEEQQYVSLVDRPVTSSLV